MTPWQPLQLLLDRACWWKQVRQALLEPGMGSQSPLPRLSLTACPGRGACPEGESGEVGARGRVQPNSAV